MEVDWNEEVKTEKGRLDLNTSQELLTFFYYYLAKKLKHAEWIGISATSFNLAQRTLA